MQRAAFLASVFVAALAVTHSSKAQVVVLQPDEAASNDTFVYKFLGNTPIGGSGAFASLLASGRAANGDHDLRSYIRFSDALLPIETSSAKLTLFVGDTALAGFGANPSASQSVTTDVYLVTSAWNEVSLTWNTQPTLGTSPIGSVVISGINQFVSIDLNVGSLISWNNPATNFGVALLQRDQVGGPSPATSVVAVYNSASAATAGNRPSLTLVVPEPTTLGLTAAAALFVTRRRR